MRRGSPPLLFLALAVVLASGAVGCHRPGKQKLRIATGQQGGTFLPLGEALAAAFRADIHGLTTEVLLSPGSDASVQMLEKREADIALISNNATPGQNESLIAPLYPETLQIVVRKAAGIASVDDLAGKRISVGPAGSGTETIAWQVLEHFLLPREKVQAVNLTPLDAAGRMEAGTLDALFVVAGIGAPAVTRLVARPDMELLSLGNPEEHGSAIDGIRVTAPYLLATVIPARAYGRAPLQAVGTVGVKALLVARKDLSPELVSALTASLFGAKARLAEKEKLLAGLAERFDATESPFPLHPGADRYLRRDDPSVFEKYTDQISLGITLGALLWSALAGLRAWRRNRQRGHIEVYFSRLSELAVRVRDQGGDTVAMERAEKELETLEAEALADLGSEKLEAGPAFRVLQEVVRTLELELQLARGAAPTRSA